MFRKFESDISSSSKKLEGVKVSESQGSKISSFFTHQEWTDRTISRLQNIFEIQVRKIEDVKVCPGKRSKNLNISNLGSESSNLTNEDGIPQVSNAFHKVSRFISKICEIRPMALKRLHIFMT